MKIFLKTNSKIIKNLKYKFYDPKNLEKNFYRKNRKKNTYYYRWCIFFILWSCLALFKKEKIPFILFVSTEAVGKNGYMTWDQIKELEKENYSLYW